MELAFNAQGINPAFGGSSGEVWGEGWHKVILTADQRRENSDPSKGAHLGFTVKAIEGEDAGKEGYIAVNVWHTDPATRERAVQQMAAICFATGVFAYANTQQLYNIPFWIENKHRTDNKNQKRNNFVAVRNLAGVEPGNANGGGGPTGGPAAPPQAPQAPQAPQYQPPANPAPPQSQPPANPAPFVPGGWAPGGAPQGQPGPSFVAQPPQGQPQQFQPPASAAPAAPSFAPPGAPAAPPAAPGGWSPNGNAAPAGGPGWGR